MEALNKLIQASEMKKRPGAAVGMGRVSVSSREGWAGGGRFVKTYDGFSWGTHGKVLTEPSAENGPG